VGVTRKKGLRYSPIRTSLKVTELCAFSASFSEGWVTSRSVMSPPAAILSSWFPCCSSLFFWFCLLFLVVLDWFFLFWCLCCSFFLELQRDPNRKKKKYHFNTITDTRDWNSWFINIRWEVYIAMYVVPTKLKNH